VRYENLAHFHTVFVKFHEILLCAIMRTNFTAPFPGDDDGESYHSDDDLHMVASGHRETTAPKLMVIYVAGIYAGGNSVD